MGATNSPQVTAGIRSGHTPVPHSVTLGIDVGGTKIAFGLFDDTNPTQPLVYERVPSRSENYTVRQALVSAVTRSKVLAEEKGVVISRIGIGAPGVIDSTRGVVVSASPTIPGWPDTDIYAAVNEALPTVPVHIHNDVRVWAFGEHRLGAGQDLGNGRILYVSLGTGVGGAVVERGQLLASPNATAGEINELMAMDFRGRADRAENIASGESLARYYNELSKKADLGRIPWRERKDTDIDLREVLDRQRKGDPLATNIIEGNIAGLGAAIGGMARAFDISAIVLGGGVAGIGPFVIENFRRGLLESLPADNPKIEVINSRFTSPDAPAAVIAAAEYARHSAPCLRS